MKRLTWPLLLAAAVVLLVVLAFVLPAFAGEACGSSGSVDCCTLGGVVEGDIDYNGYDITNLDDLDSTPMATDAAGAVTGITSKKPYQGINATNKNGNDICLYPSSGNNDITGVTRAATTGDTVTIVTVSNKCAQTTTVATEGVDYDCDGAASDAACVCNLYTYLLTVATAGKFSVARSDGTCSDERLAIFPTAGLAFSAKVYPSDGTNTVVVRGTDGVIITSDTHAINRIILPGDVADNSGACDAATLTGFAFPATSGTRYHILAELNFTSAATTTGLGISFTGPAATRFVSSCSFPIGVSNGSVNSSAAQAVDEILCSASGPFEMTKAVCNADYLPSANGTIQMIFATEINASAVTIKAGSYMDWWK